MRSIASCLPVACLFISIAVCPAVEPGPSDWPQWRGPARDSHVRDGASWPDSLSGLSEAWRVSLGPGYSGPVVHAGRVFVTETVDKQTEVVRAIDVATGRELWRKSWPGAIKVPFFARSNGDWIRSTPACDGESLYVGGIRDVLVCLDVDSGSERWRVDFPAEVKSSVPAFGFVSSPLLLGDHVYVQAGGGLAKIQKRTGEIVWKILEASGGMNSAFSSPVPATLHGRRQLLVQTRQELVGVCPDRGTVFWRQPVPAYRGMNILTPVVIDNSVFTSTYRNRSFLYSIDKDGSGYTVNEAWNIPAQGYMSSPVVIDGHAYLHLGNGRFCCIRLEDGKQMWRTGRFGKYWSMAARGDRILALDERGELLLIDANPEQFRLLDRKSVSDRECWAHVAVSGSNVFVRDLAGVSAYVWPQGGS